ncbi:MAG: hypothetical protein MJ059_06135 [Lachnospiraceae bacterium]|nr:hypothetical protein [Lachnospiraceae bacterium]
MTWSEPRRVFRDLDIPVNDPCKLTNIGNGKIMAFGYSFEGPDPPLPQGNPETGGLLHDQVFYAVSDDGGKTSANYRQNIVKSKKHPRKVA